MVPASGYALCVPKYREAGDAINSIEILWWLPGFVNCMFLSLSGNSLYKPI